MSELHLRLDQTGPDRFDRLCRMKTDGPNGSGRSGVFATTRWSVLFVAAHSRSLEGEEALDWLCRTYWPAVFHFVRRTVREPESARDLTQAFFAKLIDKGWLQSADREKGRFRTFLLTMVKRFLADQHDYATARKRGGGTHLFSLEEMVEEEKHQFQTASGLSPEQEFDRRWALAVLEKAMRRLQAEAEEAGHAQLFAAAQPFLSGGDSEETLASIAERSNLGQSAIKMRLHRWRVRYRELIQEEVVETLPRLADLDEEMRHLLAALAD